MKMGVIPINFSPEVEVHIKGLQRGNRSQWVNRLVKKAIQAELGDHQAKTIAEFSIPQLIQIATSRCLTKSYAGSPEEARLLELRNILLEHISKMAPKEL